MKTIGIIAGAAVLLAQTMPAVAGPLTIEARKDIDRLLDIVANYPALGETQYFSMKAGEVFTLPFMADATIEYYVNVICDDDCINVDLAALEADGTAADVDDADDPSPVLNVQASEYRSPTQDPPGPPRPLTIEIRMKDCKTEVCTLGLRIAQVEDWK